MLNFLLGLFIGGPAGWLANQLLGKPWTRLQELRIRARAVMDMTANVSVLTIPRPQKYQNVLDPRLKEYQNAVESLRAIGVDIGAFHETAAPPTRWLIRLLRYDLPQAKGALIGLSNSLLEKGARATLKHEIEKSLKLAMSYSEKPTRREP